MRIEINTCPAMVFGASAQRGPIQGDTIRLQVQRDGNNFMIWDMTVEQAVLLFDRLQRAVNGD